MDWKILPLLFWIGLLFISVSGQRVPGPPPPKGPPQPQQPPPPLQQSLPPPPPPNLQKSPKSIVSPPLLPHRQQNGSKIHLAQVKDENVKRILVELASPLAPIQMAETLARVAQLIGPLFYSDFEDRQDLIILQGRNASLFPQRLLSSLIEIPKEETKANILQRKLENLHDKDFGFLPMPYLYTFQDDILRNITGRKLASTISLNRGDATIAFKAAEALEERPDSEQLGFLQSLGSNIFPDVQRLLAKEVLEWWGPIKEWKDQNYSLLASAGDPLLGYLPVTELESLDHDQADRLLNILGQTSEFAPMWWTKPMSLKMAWFTLAKRARYFGALGDWSFIRLQQTSFLLEGASPQDLVVEPHTITPEIKSIIIQNHLSELQARVVFDTFYNKNPLTQEDLQEFQFHVLKLLPTQLQRFDLADSFSALDEMMRILELQNHPSYSSLLQIYYYIWPMVNTTTGLTMTDTRSWQKRELSQLGKFFFLLSKSQMFDVPPELLSWDSTTLQAIRSRHLSQFQLWFLTSEILKSVDERFKPDYVFLMPAPFQKGIPSQNLSQVLLNSAQIKPEILKTLIENSDGMLTSQKAMIVQRIRPRLNDATILRSLLTSPNPSELFEMFDPRLMSKVVGPLSRMTRDMPAVGKFGAISVKAKLLPKSVLSQWINSVQNTNRVNKWKAEDFLGRSPLGIQNSLSMTILGLTCREVKLIDPLDILPITQHYRNELYSLRSIKPDISFDLNLRPCIMNKVVEYLKIKQDLNGNQTNHAQILDQLNPGEIAGIGGEVLSVIPEDALESLPLKTRILILEEIGRLGTLDMFHVLSLEQIQWYANTLLKDLIATKSSQNSDRRKRQAPQGEESSTSTTEASTTTDDGTTDNESEIGNDEEVDPTEDQVVQSDSSPVSDVSNDGDITARTRMSQEISVDSDMIQSLGSLFCYSDDLFVGNWSIQLFKDTLESKIVPGEKSCCLNTAQRTKWFRLLQQAYGIDTSKWSEFDLAAIGDLLFTVPDAEFNRISLDTLSKAVHPIIQQSGFDEKITVAGESKKQKIISVCSEALGIEGMEMVNLYRGFMRQLAKGAQSLVNTVQTTNELITNSMTRTGRVPRWAEFSLVRNPRQINIAVGPQSTPSASTPAMNPAAINPNPIQAGPVGTTSLAAPAPVPTSSGDQLKDQMPRSFFENPFSPAPATNLAPTPDQSRIVPTTAPAIRPNLYQGQIGNQQQMSQITSRNQGQYAATSQLGNQGQISQFGNQAQDQRIFNNQNQLAGQGQIASAAAGRNQFGSQAEAVTANQNQFGSQVQIAAAGQNQFGSQSEVLGANQNQFGRQGQIAVAGQNQFGSQSEVLGAKQTQFGNQGQIAAVGQNQFGNQGQIPNQNRGSVFVGNQGQLAGQNQRQGPYSGQSQLENQSQPQLVYSGPVSNNQNRFNEQNQFANQGIQGTQASQNQLTGQNQFVNQPGQTQFGNQQRQNQFGNQFGSQQGQNQFGNQFGSQQGQNQFGNQFGSQQGQNQFGNQFGSQQGQNQFGSQQGQNQFGNQFGSQQGQNQFGNQFGSQQGQNQFGSQQGQNQFGSQQGQNQFGNQFGSQQGQNQFGNQFGSQQGQNQFGSQQGQNQFGNQFGSQQGQNQFGNQQGQNQFGNQFGSQQGQNQFGNQFGSQQGQNQFGNQQGQFIPDRNVDLTARGVNGSDPAVNGSNASDVPLSESARSLESPVQPQFNSGQGPQLTCEGIKAAGPTAIGLTLEDLDQLSENDLFDCIEALGKIDWDEHTKVGILNMIIKKTRMTPAGLTTVNMLELGNLITAIKVNSDVDQSSPFGNFNNGTSSIFDISKIDLLAPAGFDRLTIFGSKVTDTAVLKALADKFNADNGIFPSPNIARPDNLRIIVISLGNILCGFSDKVVNSIFELDSNAFIDCSPKLGVLEGCSNEVLSTLATYAVKPNNYGPPRVWTQEDVETLGVVLGGLRPEILSSIPPDSMQGMMPHAVKAIPASLFATLLPDQLSKMSYSAAKAILPSQKMALSPTQTAALNQVFQIQLSSLGSDMGTRLEETRSLENAKANNESTRVGGRTKGEDSESEETTTESSTTTSTTPETESTTATHDGAQAEVTPTQTSSANKLVIPVVVLFIQAMLLILKISVDI